MNVKLKLKESLIALKKLNNNLLQKQTVKVINYSFNNFKIRYLINTFPNLNKSFKNRRFAKANNIIKIKINSNIR